MIYWIDCDHSYEEKLEVGNSKTVLFCSLKKPKERDLESHSEQQAKLMTCRCERRGCPLGAQIQWNKK